MADNATKPTPTSSARLEKLEKEERRLVKGIFRFHECPGGTLEVPMKKYRGSVYQVNLKDGDPSSDP